MPREAHSRRDPYPEPAPPDRQPLSPEQVGEDDRLEPPGVDTRRVLLLAASLVVFIAVSLTALTSFYALETGGLQAPPFKVFPAPRLEASIDPRTIPAVQPGPAQARPPVIPGPPAQPLDTAMAAIAAKGAAAYAPLSPASSRPSRATSAAP